MLVIKIYLKHLYYFVNILIIRYNCKYICYQGPDSHYGTQGLKTVTVDTKSGPVTFHFMYAAGNNNGTNVDDGQIPEILFYT